ncbi:hypothetical protein AVEN_24501-1 [Araneus ventricosus]|uniref:Uncharacterized protein n=1 Tax=Araneus ventricosus TaxID=182803 RepID=A0A4Y2QEH9_ARAVE|nr:hypothetical protein AVEN_24501-1 [Araneus ventricosus]
MHFVFSFIVRWKESSILFSPLPFDRSGPKLYITINNVTPSCKSIRVHIKDRPPRQHSQALLSLHYSPHYERLMQQLPGQPGYDLPSETGPKSHTTIIVPSDWRELACLYGSLSSVNSRCPPPEQGVLLLDRQTQRVVSKHEGVEIECKSSS